MVVVTPTGEVVHSSAYCVIPMDANARKRSSSRHGILVQGKGKVTPIPAS